MQAAGGECSSTATSLEPPLKVLGTALAHETGSGGSGALKVPGLLGAGSVERGKTAKTAEFSLLTPRSEADRSTRSRVQDPSSKSGTPDAEAAFDVYRQLEKQWQERVWWLTCYIGFMKLLRGSPAHHEQLPGECCEEPSSPTSAEAEAEDALSPKAVDADPGPSAREAPSTARSPATPRGGRAHEAEPPPLPSDLEVDPAALRAALAPLILKGFRVETAAPLNVPWFAVSPDRFDASPGAGA